MVAGGHNGSQLLNSVEIFNVRENFWTPDDHDLPGPLIQFDLIPFLDSIYLLGGNDGDSVKSAIYKYDTTSGWVEQSTSLEGARSRYGYAIVPDDVIFCEEDH